MPQSGGSVESLDAILVSIDTLWSTYKLRVQKHDLGLLTIECQALEERFARWEAALSHEARPTTVATYKPSSQTCIAPVGRWPGSVDTYPDLYIASVWNYARAGRILLMSLMSTLSVDLGNRNESHANYASSIEVDTQKILSSVPYHLADNLYDFIKEGEREISDPGKALGGVLIMYPLFVASKSTYLPEETRCYLRRCLSWIAFNMGIGQAEVLAQV